MVVGPAKLRFHAYQANAIELEDFGPSQFWRCILGSRLRNTSTRRRPECSSSSVRPTLSRKASRSSRYTSGTSVRACSANCAASRYGGFVTRTAVPAGPAFEVARGVAMGWCRHDDTLHMSRYMSRDVLRSILLARSNGWGDDSVACGESKKSVKRVTDFRINEMFH